MAQLVHKGPLVILEYRDTMVSLVAMVRLVLLAPLAHKGRRVTLVPPATTDRPVRMVSMVQLARSALSALRGRKVTLVCQDMTEWMVQLARRAR